MDCYGERINCQAHYRVQILLWVIERPGLQEGFIGVRYGSSQKKSVAVGPRVRDLGSTQRTSGTPDIINKYRTQEGPDLVRPGTSQGVNGSARRQWNYEPDRLRRVRLGLRSEAARQRGGARCQMQKLSAWNFHGVPSPWPAARQILREHSVERKGVMSVMDMRTRAMFAPPRR